MNITVIGESNIDIAVKPQGATRQGGCTPADIAFYHGGVARNIAHNLKLLGHEVQLATVFGDDRLGQSMMEECEQLGINLSLSTQYEDAKSPLFLSINDEIGNMQSAMSDIELNSYLNLDWLMARIDAINRSDMVVADTLLSTDALAFLLDHCLVPEATKALVSKGIKEVYLTMGEDGVAFRSQKEYRHFPAIEAEAVNVTGSGDAFFAGIIHAHAIGISGMASVGYGLKAACHNVKSEAPVNPTLRLSVFE